MRLRRRAFASLARATQQQTFATTGEEALAKLREGVFDLAILDEIYGNDIEGPRLTGLQLTRAVRANGITSGSRGGPLPIIGSTGMEDAEHVAAALAAGQLTAWGKPSPPKERMREDLRRALLGTQ